MRYFRQKIINLKIAWYSKLLSCYFLKLEKISNSDFYIVSLLGIGYRKNQIDHTYTLKEEIENESDYIYTFEDLNWLLNVLNNKTK